MEQGGPGVESFTLNDDGTPLSFVLDGEIWKVAPDAVRWFERRSWWETDLRMPAAGGGARIDMEIWRVQARAERPGGQGSGLETFEIAATPDGRRIVRSREAEPAQPDDEGQDEPPA